MIDPYREACDLADGLLDETGALYNHLRDAIWAYRAATGRLPEEGQIRDYVRWCRGTGRYVSGHHGRVPPPRPREVWRAPGAALELVRRTRAETGGQGAWHLLDVHTGALAYQARSRARVLRWLEEHHTGGAWSISLPQRERAGVIRAWGEARDFARRKKIEKDAR